MTAAPYVSLGMYPFEPLVGAWEQLWAVVHAHAPWTPPALRWTGDVHADWRDAACVVTHACGWPVAAQLRGEVEVVGAFELALPDARSHHYRSVLLSPDPEVLSRLPAAGGGVAGDAAAGEVVVAAANSQDSLSGWVSLLAAVGRSCWPGPVVWTGAHIRSLAALATGQADVACIDALTLAHLGAADPTLVAGLHTVGHGPWIPNPAVVVRPGSPADHRRQLADGLRAAVSDPAIGGPLRYHGFVDLDDLAYEPTLHLVPT